MTSDPSPLLRLSHSAAGGSHSAAGGSHSAVLRASALFPIELCTLKLTASER